MKHTMTRVLTPLTALAIAFGVQAAQTTSSGFEGSGYVDNSPAAVAALATEGWEYYTNSVKVTTGINDVDASRITAYGTKPSSGLIPEQFNGDAGDNYLALSTEDGVLQRNLNGNTGFNLDTGDLFIDTDVQFTVTDSGDRPTPAGADKFIVWLEADATAHTTNLCVYGGCYDSTGAYISNKVYTITKTSADAALTVTPGQWYRLTVKAIKNVDNEATARPVFQVYLDGTLLKTETFPAADGVDFATLAGNDKIAGDAWTKLSGGTYFPAMVASMTGLMSVGFSGEGSLDNFAVTDNIPEGMPRHKVTLTWADDGIISNVTLYADSTLETPIGELERGGYVAVANGQPLYFDINSIGFDPSVADSSIYDIADSLTCVGDSTATVSEGLVTIAATSEGTNASTVTLSLKTNNGCELTLVLADGATLAGIESVSYSINNGESQSVTPSTLSRGLTIDCVKTDKVVFTVVAAANYLTGLTATSGGTLSDNEFTVSGNTAEVQITTTAIAATYDGTSYATLAEAIGAASDVTKPVALVGNVTLTAPIALADGKAVTLDLAGNTITADGITAFSNAGTLIITNSAVSGGAIVATTVVANTGTLTTQAGTFTGAFTNTGTFNVTGGTYDNDLKAAGEKIYTCADGYEVASVGSGQYELAPITYTITYTIVSAEGVAPVSTDFTVETASPITLAQPAAVEGYSFGGWKTNSDGETGESVTEYKFTPATAANQTYYGKFTQSIVTYTIIYTDNGGTWATGYTAPASIKKGDGDVTLPTSANISKSGYTFGGWYDNAGFTGSAVTVLDDDTVDANVELYAKWNENAVPGQESSTKYDTKADAEAAAADAQVVIADAAVAAALTSEEQTTYKGLFATVVKESTSEAGKYVVATELNTTGTNALQTAGTTANATVADGLSAVATAVSSANVSFTPAQKGFYYSIISGTTPGNLNDETPRQLATGSAMTFAVPNKGTAGFYKVKVSVTASGN